MKLKNIKLESVFYLLCLCSESTVMDSTFIKQKFENHFSFFEDNISFLKIIELISYENNIIEKRTISPTKRMIVDAFCERIELFPSVLTFINMFQLEDEKLFLLPLLSEIIRFADERILLVDFGLLVIDGDYCIMEHKSLVRENKAKPVSLESLRKKIQQQEIMGLEAENIVLNFELSESADYPLLIPISEICYVSPYNVCAGYDIIGFSRVAAANGEFKKTFIEVKCISDNSVHFYWSRNEISVAKELESDYYLYLVKKSALTKKTVTRSNLVIIQNPYKNVFCNPIWQQEYESIRFEKKEISLC